jgi:hypothetical protein
MAEERQSLSTSLNFTTSNVLNFTTAKTFMKITLFGFRGLVILLFISLIADGPHPAGSWDVILPAHAGPLEKRTAGEQSCSGDWRRRWTIGWNWSAPKDHKCNEDRRHRYSSQGLKGLLGV